MIFDAHAHIYPDAIALKAAHSIAEFYDIPVLCDGTLGTLLEIGAKNDITRFLVHSVAMSPKRTRHIDDYIAQCAKQAKRKSNEQRRLASGSVARRLLRIVERSSAE